MLSFTNTPNTDAVVFKLLKYLKIDVEPQVITAELEKHPDYPSMLAISDVLNALDIVNSAIRVSYEEMEQLSCPFIAHTQSDEIELCVVSQIEHGHVFLSNEKWDRHKLKNEEFKKMYAGVVLIAERSESFTIKPTSKAFLTTIKLPAILTGLVLILAAALFNSGYFVDLSLQLLLLTIFKSAGLIISVLLLVQSIDTDNPLVQKLCQSGSKINCNAILSSKAAKVFEGLTWSEVGFFYFAGTWLLILFGGTSTVIWQVLALLNFISLPYTIYSIYYQSRVAKQWCLLCCSVQALLWLEFIPLFTVLNKSTLFPTVGKGEFGTLLICLLSPVIIWVLLKPLFLKLQQLPTLKQQLRTFKYNTGLFYTLLSKQPKYVNPDEQWSIVLGNMEANNTITMVTNPYCPPCAKTHAMLDDLLEKNNDLQARIVFTAQNTDVDRNTPISRHLMAMNELPDKTKVKQALHDWYGQKQKDYEAWAKAYPVSLNDANYYKLDKQKTWCQMAEVTATPTLLLNGYRMPELYQLQDLKYMLE